MFAEGYEYYIRLNPLGYRIFFLPVKEQFYFAEI